MILACLIQILITSSHSDSGIQCDEMGVGMGGLSDERIRCALGTFLNRDDEINDLVFWLKNSNKAIALDATYTELDSLARRGEDLVNRVHHKITDSSNSDNNGHENNTSPSLHYNDHNNNSIDNNHKNYNTYNNNSSYKNDNSNNGNNNYDRKNNTDDKNNNNNNENNDDNDDNDNNNSICNNHDNGNEINVSNGNHRIGGNSALGLKCKEQDRELGRDEENIKDRDRERGQEKHNRVELSATRTDSTSTNSIFCSHMNNISIAEERKKEKEKESNSFIKEEKLSTHNFVGNNDSKSDLDIDNDPYKYNITNSYHDCDHQPHIKEEYSQSHRTSTSSSAKGANSIPFSNTNTNTNNNIHTNTHNSSKNDESSNNCSSSSNSSSSSSSCGKASDPDSGNDIYYNLNNSAMYGSSVPYANSCRYDNYSSVTHVIGSKAERAQGFYRTFKRKAGDNNGEQWSEENNRKYILRPSASSCEEDGGGGGGEKGMTGGASGTGTGMSAGVGGSKGHLGVNGPGLGFGTSGRQGILDPRSFNDNVQYSLFGRMENRNSSTSSSSSNNGDGTGDSNSRLKFLRLSGRESGGNREDGNYNYNYNYTDKRNSNDICEKVKNNNNNYSNNNDDDDDSDNHNDRRGVSSRVSTDRGTDIHRRMDSANILGMGMGMGIDVNTSRNKDAVSIQSHSRPQARNVMRDRMEDISHRNSCSSSGTAHHERGGHSIVKHSNSHWNERRNHYENEIKVEKHDSSKSRSEDGSYHLDVSNERQMNIDDMRGNESKKDFKVERRLMKKNNSTPSNCAYSLWGLEDDYYNKNRTRNMKYEIKNEIDDDIGPDTYRYGEGNNPLDICHGFESKKQSQSEQQQQREREMGGESDRGMEMERGQNKSKSNAVSSSRYWLMGCGVDHTRENESINFNVTSKDNVTENANDDVSHTNEDILVQEKSSHRHNHKSNNDNNNMSNNSEGSDNSDKKSDSSVRSRPSEALKIRCDDEEHSQDMETDTDNEREPRMTHNVSPHSSFTLSSICDDDDVEADNIQNSNIHHSNSNSHSSSSNRNRNQKKNSSRKSEIRTTYDSNCIDTDRRERDDSSNCSDNRDNEAIPDHEGDRNSFEGAGVGVGLLRKDKALSLSSNRAPPISRGEHPSTSGREIFGMHGTVSDAPGRPGRNHYHSYQGADSNHLTGSRDNASSDNTCDAVYESARAGMNAVTLKKRKLPPLSTSASIPTPTFPTESARMPPITTTSSPSSSRSLLHSLVDLLEQHQELDYIAETQTQTRQQGSSHSDDNNSNIKGFDHINNNRKGRDKGKDRGRIAEHSNSIVPDNMAL